MVALEEETGLQGDDIGKELAFLRKLVRHPDFVAGDVDTGLIGRDLDDLAADPVPCSRSRALAALAALVPILLI